MVKFASELVEQLNLDVVGTGNVSARDIGPYRPGSGDYCSLPLE